jgi:hypothetical protein
MKRLAVETLRRIDQELAGIGFAPHEIEQITPHVGAWAEEIAALDEIDVGEIEPSLVYFLEEE